MLRWSGNRASGGASSMELRVWNDRLAGGVLMRINGGFFDMPIRCVPIGHETTRTP